MRSARGPRWVLVLTLGLALSASATTYPGLDWARMLALSDMVVRVQVQTAEARSLRDAGRGAQKLATFYDASVLEILRGELPSSASERPRLTFAFPGGVVDGVKQRVSGMPTLEVGGEYVLFLGPPSGPGGARGVVGHALGTLRVLDEKLFGDRELGAHAEIPRRLASLRAKLSQAPAAPAIAPGTVPIDIPR